MSPVMYIAPDGLTKGKEVHHKYGLAVRTRQHRDAAASRDHAAGHNRPRCAIGEDLEDCAVLFTFLQVLLVSLVLSYSRIMRKRFDKRKRRRFGISKSS